MEAAPALEAGGEIRVGSSPIASTKINYKGVSNMYNIETYKPLEALQSVQNTDTQKKK